VARVAVCMVTALVLWGMLGVIVAGMRVGGR